MLTVLKLAITVAVILICTQVGRKYPGLGGLIATMPLTGLLVLLWLYFDDPSQRDILAGYTKGALFGIFPSILFYLAAWACLSRGMSLPSALASGFGLWMAGAVLHQILLR